MREEQSIENILGHFRRSASQKNKPFTCDAEIIDIGGKLFAVTMDEFSPDEDMFGDIAPHILGRNLAIAAISDLFACGAMPRFFMHSIVAVEKMDPSFFKGISEVLEECGCFLIGGDTGGGDSFRYTAAVIGTVDGDKYLSRQLPRSEQSLWITGKLGDANLAAFNSSAMPPFELRLEEAAYIRNNATGCIDTSGGLIDAMWMLQKVNPKMRFEIDADKLPFDESVRQFCLAAELPQIAFAFGGAGEYELLFTTPPQTATPVNAACIGRTSICGEGGIYIKFNGKLKRIEEPPVCGRDITDKNIYISSILRQVNAIIR